MKKELFSALPLSISLGKVLSTFGDYAELSVKIGGNQHSMGTRFRIYVIFPLSIASLSIIPFGIDSIVLEMTFT